LSLILVFVFIAAAAAQDVYISPGDMEPDSWDPKFPNWVSGNNASLMEGQTAPNAVRLAVDPAQVGVPYKLTLCLQVVESPFTAAYGFTAFEPFDKSFAKYDGIPAIDPIPTAFDYGAPIDYPTYALPAWDRGDPNIWGYNITINSVTAAAMGWDVCDPNELGLTLEFVIDSITDPYITFGAHIAKAGDPLPAGAPEPPGLEDGFVSPGESASFMTGNFQTRMATPAGDKTLPFKVQYNPNAVELSSFGATATQALPYGLALLGLAGAGALGFAIRRRK
jgi:hypothetical protein